MPTLDIQVPFRDTDYQKSFISRIFTANICETQDSRLLVPSRGKEAFLQVVGVPNAGRLTYAERYAERFLLFSYRINSYHYHVHARVNTLCIYIYMCAHTYIHTYLHRGMPIAIRRRGDRASKANVAVAV